MFGGCFLPTWINQMVCGDDVIKSEGAQPILLWHRQMVVWWLYVTYVVNIFPSFTLYRSFPEGLKVSSPCACTWPKYEGLLDQGLGWDQSHILSHVLRSPYLQNTSKHWQKVFGTFIDFAKSAFFVSPNDCRIRLTSSWRRSAKRLMPLMRPTRRILTRSMTTRRSRHGWTRAWLRVETPSSWWLARWLTSQSRRLIHHQLPPSKVHPQTVLFARNPLLNVPCLIN